MAVPGIEVLLRWSVAGIFFRQDSVLHIRCSGQNPGVPIDQIQLNKRFSSSGPRSVDWYVEMLPSIISGKELFVKYHSCRAGHPVKILPPGIHGPCMCSEMGY